MFADWCGKVLVGVAILSFLAGVCVVFSAIGAALGFVITVATAATICWYGVKAGWNHVFRAKKEK